MVERQLRRRGITEPIILDAFRQVPRELFVSDEYAHLAYGDHPLPIEAEQTISQPYIVAVMSEAIRLRGGEKVLEIGTGSGYQAAILSRLCREVVTIERFRALADRARVRLEKLHCDNIEVMLGDGFAMPEQLGQFDRIIVTAAMTEIPEALVQRLEPDGILIAPVGPHHGVQTLVRVKRTESGFDRKELVDVRFVPALPGIAKEL